ncbi:MAG: site-2 protease family protein [Candidatus ainarchaeum sp.]|nr:site-2 protease family protein [Candidatus ainarchaeum sp.]
MTTKKSIWYFSKQEKIDLLISWLTLSLAFAVVISPIFLGIPEFIISFPIALIAVGTGFVLHEMAHRQMARHFGFHSEYRAWYPGLVFAFFLALITKGAFIFAAPGATYFFGETVTTQQEGKISIAGPITNLVVGFILIFLFLFSHSSFWQIVLIKSALINFWFAAFNLIPFGPLDGAKVMKWNSRLWILVFAISALLALFPIQIFTVLNLI